jgi:hypothetical protein
MKRTFDDQAAAELKAQLSDLFEGLDAEELRTVAAQVNDLIRAGDQHPSRHAGGPIDDDDGGDDGDGFEFEKHRAGLMAMYGGDLRAARRAFAEAKKVGWPPEATDQYAEDAAVSGPAFRRAEAPAQGTGTKTIPATRPFKYDDDPRLRANRSGFRQFSEAAAHRYKLKTTHSLSKIWSTLTERELASIVLQHARGELSLPVNHRE